MRKAAESLMLCLLVLCLIAVFGFQKTAAYQGVYFNTAKAENLQENTLLCPPGQLPFDEEAIGLLPPSSTKRVPVRIFSWGNEEIPMLLQASAIRYYLAPGINCGEKALPNGSMAEAEAQISDGLPTKTAYYIRS